MKYLLRRLAGQCTSCGQKLKSEQTMTKRMSEINSKADVLTTSFGRKPQVQSCNKCHRIIFEGDKGFVQSVLLTDMS